ncbi:Uncharacterised protein [Klebsiella pneumoniae]|nr:Uncharacterised protein [Klebsiella pneumoniae]SAU96056.1 Uncharacterised protein [Klebsiella pneumoniae]
MTQTHAQSSKLRKLMQQLRIIDASRNDKVDRNIVLNPVVLNSRPELTGIKIPLIEWPIHPQCEFFSTLVNRPTKGIANGSRAISGIR